VFVMFTPQGAEDADSPFAMTRFSGVSNTPCWSVGVLVVWRTYILFWAPIVTLPDYVRCARLSVRLAEGVVYDLDLFSLECSGLSFICTIGLLFSAIEGVVWVVSFDPRLIFRQTVDSTNT
jgi:hypothetical protein